MLINEACKKSGLTKKSILYYEEKGLISPQILENNYRDYSEEDIITLKEISVLRKCEISIEDIKKILKSDNKPVELAKHYYVSDFKIQRIQSIRDCMKKLIGNYDIQREFEYLQSDSDNLSTIKERLLFAFPGNYGIFLSLHFSKFLDEKIDTQQKKTAFKAILKYLDDIDLFITTELTELLSNLDSLQKLASSSELQSEINDSMTNAISDTDSYMRENKVFIEEYLAFKASAEFSESVAGQLQRCLLEFQNKSGYQEILIENMKILSKSYTEYIKQLEIANDKFIEKFPMAKDIYDKDKKF